MKRALTSLGKAGARSAREILPLLLVPSGHERPRFTFPQWESRHTTTAHVPRRKDSLQHPENSSAAVIKVEDGMRRGRGRQGPRARALTPQAV